MLVRQGKRIQEISRSRGAGTVLLVTLLTATLLLTACSAGTAVAPTAVPAKPATSSAAAGATTAGTLAAAGQTVYAGSCASCHGNQGQGGAGPAVIGSGAQLGKYSTGKGLYDKVSTTMPRSSPGSLSADQYLQVTAFLLVQNKYVQPTAPLDASGLSDVKLQ